MIVASSAICIVVNRRNPESGNAEVLEVWQALLNAAQVPAMVSPGLGPIICPGRRKVVVGIAIGEAIGHDQVDYVIGTEAAEALIDAGSRSFSAGFRRSNLQSNVRLPWAVVTCRPERRLQAVTSGLLGENSAALLRQRNGVGQASLHPLFGSLGGQGFHYRNIRQQFGRKAVPLL